jgi:predicted DNA-binding protein with PD1-like motif
LSDHTVLQEQSMKYTTGTVGRVITIRFEDGDPIYQGIEDVAAKEMIDSAVIWLIGGVKNGGVVVGPSDDSMPPVPMIERFTDAREIAGIGTLFPDDDNRSSLHLHASIGKGTAPLTGCPRKGLDCWLITEAIIMEMKGVNARRLKDTKSGFSLLEIVD